MRAEPSAEEPSSLLALLKLGNGPTIALTTAKPRAYLTHVCGQLMRQMYFPTGHRLAHRGANTTSNSIAEPRTSSPQIRVRLRTRVLLDLVDPALDVATVLGGSHRDPLRGELSQQVCDTRLRLVQVGGVDPGVVRPVERRGRRSLWRGGGLAGRRGGVCSQAGVDGGAREGGRRPRCNTPSHHR